MFSIGNDSIMPMANNANGGAAENGQVAKKLVGGIYQCENCGSDYECHSTRQKYCPECSAINKKSFLLRKAIKKGKPLA